MEEQDVQLPRPLSATESREVWSGVSSSVEVEEVKVEARAMYPRAKDEELLQEKVTECNNEQVKIYCLAYSGIFTLVQLMYFL